MSVGRYVSNLRFVAITILELSVGCNAKTSLNQYDITLLCIETDIME